MLRRAFTIIVVLSAIVFAVFAGGLVRQHFASDDFRIIRWNASTRRYTEIFFGWRGHSFFAHSESATALASDNTSMIQSRAGPSNLRFMHSVWPPDGTSNGPFLWGDHFRSTPSFGINQMGLSDCWSLLFRMEVALALFAVVPGIWGAMRLRRMMQRRARGFAVVGHSVQ